MEVSLEINVKKEVGLSGDASASASANEDEVPWSSQVFRKAADVNKTWKIQKVPRILRENNANAKDYDPLVVSIGPYHHGKPELQLMESLKYEVVKLYAENEVNLENLYTKVNKVAQKAREFYKDDDEQSVSKLDDEKFTQMMCLDGCFVLHFIYSFAKDQHRQLGMKDNIAAFISRDLLLLENQLPFVVLSELINDKSDSKTFNEMLGKFLLKTKTGWPHKTDPWEESSKCFENIKARLRHRGFLNMPTCTPQSNCPKDWQHIEIPVTDNSPTHLLDIIRKWLVGKIKFQNGNCGDWASYRSVKELKAVGIHVRPSKTHELIDVKFKSTFFAARLYLPPITVDDSTKSMLLNMAAHEACPGISDDLGVSSYICFLDSLIDHAEDVKELRSKGILKNFLGSDQQVADLFNQISDNLVADPKFYCQVKIDIENHYNNKIKNWLAEFWHTHFSSPWTVLAFVGVVLALALSVIQAFPSLISKEH